MRAPELTEQGVSFWFVIADAHMGSRVLDWPGMEYSASQALRDAFGSFLAERTLPRFLAARDLLLGLPSHDPWSPELATFDQMLEERRWRAMRDLAERVMDNWLLTPYVHEVLALACKELGDNSRSELEAGLFQACCQGILLTGDGTKAHPYLTVGQVPSSV